MVPTESEILERLREKGSRVMTFAQLIPEHERVVLERRAVELPSVRLDLRQLGKTASVEVQAIAGVDRRQHGHLRRPPLLDTHEERDDSILALRGGRRL